MNDEMIVHAGPEEHDAAIAKPQTGEFGFPGRSMKGMVMLASQALGSDVALDERVGLTVRFALSLPAK